LLDGTGHLGAAREPLIT